MGKWCSCLRQEGGKNLQPHVLLIPVAIGAPLNQLDLVIQSFDEAELDLVTGRAIHRDAIPVPFDQADKLLEGEDLLPFELLAPAGEELAGPTCPAIRPELAEFFLEEVGGGQALVGSQQLPQRAAACQREI